MWNVIEEAVISAVIVILVQFCLLLQPLKILELLCVILTSDLALRTLLIFNFKDIVVFSCCWQRWTAVVDCLNIFSRFIARVFWKFLKVISMTVVPTLGYVSNFFTICSFYMYFSKSCIHPFKRYVGMLKVKRGHVNIFFFLSSVIRQNFITIPWTVILIVFQNMTPTCHVDALGAFVGERLHN